MNHPIKKYNSRNNPVYIKYYNGYEQWIEYDENDNLIYLKDSYGKELRKEFNKNGKEIYYKSPLLGSEYWYKYDKDDKQVEITKEEFEQIKSRIEFLKRKHVPRYKILDI